MFYLMEPSIDKILLRASMVGESTTTTEHRTDDNDGGKTEALGEKKNLPLPIRLPKKNT
jgi:hypothetical protein